MSCSGPCLTRRAAFTIRGMELADPTPRRTVSRPGQGGRPGDPQSDRAYVNSVVAWRRELDGLDVPVGQVITSDGELR
jgi:hypothetical protein